MKKIKLNTSFDCCDKLARGLRLYRNAHRCSTALTSFVKYLAKERRACNAKEAIRLFNYFIAEGILKVNEDCRYSWDVKEDFFTIDRVQKIIIEGNIASVYGNHGHRNKVATPVEEVKPEVKEDVAYCGITVCEEPYNVFNGIITDDLVKELHRRGYEVTLTYKV